MDGYYSAFLRDRIDILNYLSSHYVFFFSRFARKVDQNFFNSIFYLLVWFFLFLMYVSNLVVFCFGLSCTSFLPAVGRIFCPLMLPFDHLQWWMVLIELSTLQIPPQWSGTLLPQYFFRYSRRDFRRCPPLGWTWILPSGRFGWVSSIIPLRKDIGFPESAIANTSPIMSLNSLYVQIILLLVCSLSCGFQILWNSVDFKTIPGDFLPTIWWHEIGICHWVVVVPSGDGIFFFIFLQITSGLLHAVHVCGYAYICKMSSFSALCADFVFCWTWL